MKLPMSACLIANKIDGVRRCLDSVKNIAQQLVILDTGNGEIENLAIKYGATTGRFNWCDDFAAARNASLKLATQDWILIIDSDEALPKDASVTIKKHMQQGHIAYNVVTKNYTRDNTCTNWKPLTEEDEEARKLGFSGWYNSYKIRLFKNHKGLKFEGRVHELIKEESVLADFFVHHLEEQAVGTKEWKEKKNYYLKLGQMKLADDPLNAQSHYELGVQYAELGDPEKALICLKKVVELDPDFGDQYYGNAYFEIGNLYSTAFNDPEQASFYYHKSAEKRPKHGASYYNLGLTHEKKNDFQKAEELYRKATEIDPHFAAAHNNLANVCISLGKYKEALASANKARILDPKFKIAYQNASYALFSLGRIEEAFELAELATNKFPSDPAVFYDLGRLHYKTNNIDNAIQCFKTSISNDPKRTEAYNHLASIYMDLGLHKLAGTVFTEAIEQCGQRFDLLNNLGVFKLQTRKRDEAKIHFQEAYKLGDAEEKKQLEVLCESHQIFLTGKEENLQRFEANIAFSLSKGDMPVGNITGLRVTFPSPEEILAYLKLKYEEMYSLLEKKPSKVDYWEIGISFLHPSMESVSSYEIEKTKFKIKKEGQAFLESYVKKVMESVHA